ncbi:MAG: hypothetical protein GY818_13335 [Planctomycetaceae bacterium]|nr:hypothetical protein [Planctomycetaceae bacterium]
MTYTFDTAKLTSAILSTVPKWETKLNRSSPTYSNGLWCVIKLISDGNLRQAEHKMATRIGRVATKAYKTEKELQAIGQ